MKVFFKNKFLSIGGSSEVTDEQGEVVFKVEGKVFTFTRKKNLLDKEGNLLYIIKNRWFNMFAHKVYIYDADKNKVATIKKNKFSFNLNYEILDCVDEMKIEGKFFTGRSQILRNGEQVGVISRESSLIVDSFSLEADEKDIPFFTAIVVAFDNLNDEKDRDLRK